MRIYQCSNDRVAQQKVDQQSQWTWNVEQIIPCSDRWFTALLQNSGQPHGYDDWVRIEGSQSSGIVRLPLGKVSRTPESRHWKELKESSVSAGPPPQQANPIQGPLWPKKETAVGPHGSRIRPETSEAENSICAWLGRRWPLGYAVTCPLSRSYGKRHVAETRHAIKITR
jgi:hypothetical protein